MRFLEPHALLPARHRDLCVCVTIHALALVLGAPRPASAFAEDVCLVDGVITNCFTLSPECDPETTPAYDTPACEAAALAGATGGAVGRSTVHVDATFYIARVAGLSEADAYQVAAYDEATDIAIYVPRDQYGAPLVDPTDLDGDLVPDVCVSAEPDEDCDLVTAPMDGVTRLNTATGGQLLHFPPPFHGLVAGPVDGIDGLHPDPSDAEVEVVLANLRRWAFSGTPSCAAGLTTVSATGDYATGPGCYARSGLPAPITWMLTAVFPVAMTSDTHSGLQILAEGPTPDVRSDQLGAWVGPDIAPLAALGVYLHALADRISHHRCLDDSFMNGPYASGDAFVADLSGPECGQIHHVARHAWETGVDQDALNETDRTTREALEAVFDELEAWGVATGRSSGVSDTRRSLALDTLESALAVRDAADRVEALVVAGCDLGYEPMPGHGTCAAR